MTKTIAYTFFDSAKFMANLVNSLAEGIHKIKCKNEHNNEKCEAYGIKYKYCDCFLVYTNFRDNLIEYKCLRCNTHYQKKFDENLKKRFLNTYKFSNLISASIFFCCKKEDFYSHLNMMKIKHILNILMKITRTQREFTKILK